MEIGVWRLRPASGPRHPGVRTEQIDRAGCRLRAVDESADIALPPDVDLRCDEPHLFDSVLPHETTHVVLAGRFGSHNVPRWADEGIAVLTEPRERVNLHLRNLPKHRADGHLFGLGQLMQMTSYPEARYVGPFYAQSVSLVDFLSKRKGPVTFTRFLREGLDGGYEPALRKYYGFRSFAELDRAWRAYAFAEATTTSQPKR